MTVLDPVNILKRCNEDHEASRDYNNCFLITTMYKNFQKFFDKYSDFSEIILSSWKYGTVLKLRILIVPRLVRLAYNQSFFVTLTLMHLWTEIVSSDIKLHSAYVRMVAIFKRRPVKATLA